VSEGGTYSLLVGVFQTITVTVGALGEVRFEPGWYAYSGSARAPGGFLGTRSQRRACEPASTAAHSGPATSPAPPPASPARTARLVGIAPGYPAGDEKRSH
jgi:hypothetical protein